MIEHTPSRLTTQPDRKDGPSARLDANTLARLESFARARGISIDELVDQLIETGTCRIVRDAGSSQALSPKQQQVLECLKAGLSVKEIAGQLGVKEETVRTHILRMRSHLGCSDLLSLRFQ